MAFGRWVLGTGNTVEFVSMHGNAHGVQELLASLCDIYICHNPLFHFWPGWVQPFSGNFVWFRPSVFEPFFLFDVWMFHATLHFLVKEHFLDCKVQQLHECTQDGKKRGNLAFTRVVEEQDRLQWMIFGLEWQNCQQGCPFVWKKFFSWLFPKLQKFCPFSKPL